MFLDEKMKIFLGHNGSSNGEIMFFKSYIFYFRRCFCDIFAKIMKILKKKNNISQAFWCIWGHLALAECFYFFTKNVFFENLLFLLKQYCLENESAKINYFPDLWSKNSPKSVQNYGFSGKSWNFGEAPKSELGVWRLMKAAI